MRSHHQQSRPRHCRAGPQAGRQVPDTLHELWWHPAVRRSPGGGGAVVTGDGRGVTGRDPAGGGRFVVITEISGCAG